MFCEGDTSLPQVCSEKPLKLLVWGRLCSWELGLLRGLDQIFWFDFIPLLGESNQDGFLRVGRHSGLLGLTSGEEKAPRTRAQKSWYFEYQRGCEFILARRMMKQDIP